jgi:hypothetical protein
MYITNNKGMPIFSSGQVTSASCHQNEADLHALVFGLRVVDLLGIQHIAIRCTNDEITQMMKNSILPPEGAMRGLRFIAAGIASSFKQLVFSTVSLNFCAMRPCLDLLDSALNGEGCFAFLHDKKGQKKDWAVPPLHAADTTGGTA